MKIVWSPQAENDLEDVWRYIAQDSPRSADLVENRIIDAVSGLIDHPLQGRKTIGRDTRELIVRKASHLIVYRVRNSRVEIVRIWHMSRDPSRKRDD